MTWKKLNSAVSYWDKPSLQSQKSRFMALSVDKSSINNKIKYGIAREVYQRKGKVNVEGFVDKSRLVIVKSSDLLNWKKTKELKIKGIEKVIKKIKKPFMEFIGLEDPDIYRDKQNKIHLFYTIAFRNNKQNNFSVFLGHAEGNSLDNIMATKPALSPKIKHGLVQDGFKEISIIPSTNLAFVEIGSGGQNTKIGLTKFNKISNLKFQRVILEPKKINSKWCNGEISPGPVLKIANEYIGFLNGRNKAKKIKNKITYGIYKIGLMKLNKEGFIKHVSSTPFISDVQSKSVTFVSNLVELNNKEEILYAHVNDSFVRAYKIYFKKLRKFLH